MTSSGTDSRRRSLHALLATATLIPACAGPDAGPPPNSPGFVIPGSTYADGLDAETQRAPLEYLKTL